MNTKTNEIYDLNQLDQLSPKDLEKFKRGIENGEIEEVPAGLKSDAFKILNNKL